MAPTGFNDAALIGQGKRTVRQADGKNLVRTDAVVDTIRPVDHVVQALSVGPQKPCEAGPRGGSLGRERVRLAQHHCEVRHDAQRVVPQRVDLHRLADPRGHHPISNLGVHPGELHAVLAGPQQTIRGVHFDTVTRAAPVPGDHVGKHGKRHAQRCHIAGRRDIGAPGLEEPQRGVGGVVVRDLANTREHVGQHPLADKAGEGPQNSQRNVVPPGRQRQTGQTDHRVAPPVAEPGITGNHRLAVRDIGQRARDQEGVSGEHKPVDPGWGRLQRGGGQHLPIMRKPPFQCRTDLVRRNWV